MRTRFALTNGILALAFVVAGCASSGSTSTSATAAATAGPAAPISITVDNNLQELKDATISIIRSTGGTKFLGIVNSGRRKTFSYDATPGAYSLIAKTSSQNNTVITSQAIQINGAQSYTWHLQTNTVVEGQ